MGVETSSNFVLLFFYLDGLNRTPFGFVLALYFYIGKCYYSDFDSQVLLLLVKVEHFPKT